MREHKKIANYLPALAILFFVFITTAFVLMPEPDIKFELSREETLSEVIKKIKVIQPEQVKEIIKSNDQDFQFIDLRSPKEYNLHHIQDAINIPVHDLLKSENKNILNPIDKMNILYGGTVEDACPSWLILQQLNFSNNSIMLGGYNLVKSNIIDKYAPEEVWFKNEVAKYDYAEIVKETAGAGSNAVSSTPKKKPPVKRKKKKGVAGGC
jgi:rhodanese-related sulfurtransferase